MEDKSKNRFLSGFLLIKIFSKFLKYKMNRMLFAPKLHTIEVAKKPSFENIDYMYFE